MSPASLVDRDRAHCWHPYTQHATEAEPLPIVSASGALLRLEDGRELIDAISSWWAVLHGHGQAELLEAMSTQAARLDHVLFAGATHEPAVRLAERLVEVAPQGLSRVFYSDDGSTAVEVALKMAYQRHVQLKGTRSPVFVCLAGAYHGDTLGAMSVGDPEPFFRAFEPLLFEVRRVPAESGAVREALEELGENAAGVLLEPLLQGAAGMVMQPPAFLREVRAACDAAGVPLIADEVLTGFGRTGRLFACEHAGIAPDILCLAKGLTGGLLPLAATLATEEIYEAFLSPERDRAFFHGHTFTAHPIGCAVALASLELVLETDVPARLDSLGERIEAGLAPLADHPRAGAVRRLGGIVAYDLTPAPGERAGYLNDMALRLRVAAVERGVLLRPLGNVVYAMPPACTTASQAESIAAVMVELADIVR